MFVFVKNKTCKIFLQKRKSKSLNRVDNLKLITIFMKNFNLSAYNVEEMDEREVRETNGGIIPVLANIATIYGGIVLVAYYKGYYDGKNAAKS